MRRSLFGIFGAALLLLPAQAIAGDKDWTGQDLTINANTTLDGIQSNIRNLVILQGVTVKVTPGLALEFDAQIRFVRELMVRTPDETMARQGKPDWTRDEIVGDILRRNVLGMGLHAAGETKSIQAAAMFDDLENNYRFRLIDKRFEGRTSLRRGTEGSR